MPVLVPAPEEYVALGAARQAAWALAGTDEPPAWPRQVPDEYTGGWVEPAIRERLAWLGDATREWDDAAPGLPLAGPAGGGADGQAAMTGLEERTAR